MKKSSNVSPLCSFFLFMFFAFPYFHHIGFAQEIEPFGYNPCPPLQEFSAICSNGGRLCYTYGQFPCSTGYCWSGGGIPNNAGIPANGLVENKTIDIGGTYTITQNVKFTNCHFKMQGDSRIIIAPAGNALMKITFENCYFFGCNKMWQGISIDASAATGGLKFNFSQNTIEDAYIGLTIDELNGGYSLYDNFFQNNHIGVANLRQSWAGLNTVFVRNQFYQTAPLAAVTGSLIGVPMPDYPSSYAGIKLTNTVAGIGQNQNGTANIFSCLVNGLITRGGKIVSTNNTFEFIRDNGIWSSNGGLIVSGCRFQGGGGTGVRTFATSLTANNTNVFEGSWVGGIFSEVNTSSEKLLIEFNEFNIDGPFWRYGVRVERPQATLGNHCTIYHNIFTVDNTNPNSGLPYCIWINDLAEATDEAIVHENVISVGENGGGRGIYTYMGGSDNFNYIHNILNSEANVNLPPFGLFLESYPNQAFSLNHKVRDNIVSGIDIDNSVECCIHSLELQGVEYCYNHTDFSRRGLHFAGANNVEIRENHFEHLKNGLIIGAGPDSRIGKQVGRGNQWNLDPNACVEFAAENSTFGNIFNSEIIVSSEDEGIILPWLPSNSKISPDPSLPSKKWFHAELNVDLDYCMFAMSEYRALTPYEKEVVEGNSVLTGVDLWDLTIEVYSKLLIFPELRPASSPEEVFFNSFGTNNSIVQFAQVSQQIRNALTLQAADQAAIDNAQSAIELSTSGFTAFDGNGNYLMLNNLSDNWFNQRSGFLQLLAGDVFNYNLVKNARVQQLNQALQSALNSNNAIVTAFPYESARKTLNELRIRHLLGETITQSLYEQALFIAKEDISLTGKAVRYANGFLEFCDQTEFREEENEERNHGHIRSNQIAEPTMQVTPNPTTGLIEVSLSTGINGVIKVYNSNGQEIKSLPLDLSMTRILLNLEQNPTGLYWVILNGGTNDFISATKISVVH